jgi:hypothetical protein
MIFRGDKLYSNHSNRWFPNRVQHTEHGSNPKEHVYKATANSEGFRRKKGKKTVASLSQQPIATFYWQFIVCPHQSLCLSLEYSTQNDILRYAEIKKNITNILYETFSGAGGWWHSSSIWQACVFPGCWIRWPGRQYLAQQSAFSESCF